MRICSVTADIRREGTEDEIVRWIPGLDREVVEALGNMEPQCTDWIEVADVGTSALHLLGDLRERALEQSADLQQSPTTRVVRPKQSNQRCCVLTCPLQRLIAMFCEPVEQLGARSGMAGTRRSLKRQGDRLGHWGESVQLDDAVRDREPATIGFGGRCPRRALGARRDRAKSQS